MIALVWVSFSIWIAIPWIYNTSNVVGVVLSVLIISGIAFIPGYIIAFIYSTIAHGKIKDYRYENVSDDVSILISAYNEEDNILDTILSIINQKYLGKCEIVIVNDGSIDNTDAIISDFIKDNDLVSDISFVYINLDKNVGKSQALNIGLSKVSNEVLVTLDADSVMHDNALQTIVNHLVNSDSDVVSVAGAILSSNTDTSFMTKIQDWDYKIGINAIKRAQSIYQNVLVTQGAFSCFYTSAVREVGGWKDTVGEDIVLTWDLLNKKYKTEYEPHAILYTNTPTTYRQFFNQRRRWSRGLVEAFKHAWGNLFKIRKGMLYFWVNLAFPFIDIVFTFVFVPSIILALFFQYYLFVGALTLLIIPLSIMVTLLIYHKQKRTFQLNNIDISTNFLYLFLFVIMYQFIQVPATLSGYASEIINLSKTWGTK